MATRPNRKTGGTLSPPVQAHTYLFHVPTGLADGFGLKEMVYPFGIHPYGRFPRSLATERLGNGLLNSMIGIIGSREERVKGLAGPAAAYASNLSTAGCRTPTGRGRRPTVAEWPADRP